MQSNSSDDHSGSNDLDFNIFFATPREFEVLSNDWDVNNIYKFQIELVDMSSNGYTDYLQIQKV